MTKTKFLTLVMALALLLGIPTAAFANNAMPHLFVGSVTLDGATAADGAAVTAWVGGEQVADTTVKDGNYDILVESEAGYHGETVSFKVSGVDAAEVATWEEGGASILDLTASSAASSSDGESGEKGASGATGAQGPKGSTGPAGPAGPAGADGKDGSDGKAGAAGVAGAAGKAGAAGAAGSAGSAGSAGVAGADGGGGALGVIALIIAIVALVAAGGAFMAGRRA
ncbi:MAG: hypothetical protein BZY87_00510 [SAR202 cluster bacterium Io17-Chloro-G6]|nr:MAG: hypothetical protein BZY87_00510 [SAR202 cluster bacterium Io17-Chloro-G6]